MNEAADVIAGRAFVDLYLRDQQYIQGLAAMKDKLLAFSQATGTSIADSAAKVQRFMSGAVSQGAISSANATRVISATFTEARLSGQKFASNLMKYSVTHFAAAKTFQAGFGLMGAAVRLPLQAVGGLANMVGSQLLRIAKMPTSIMGGKAGGIFDKIFFGVGGAAFKGAGMLTSGLGKVLGFAPSILSTGAGKMADAYAGMFKESWRTRIMARLGAPWLQGQRGSAFGVPMPGGVAGAPAVQPPGIAAGAAQQAMASQGPAQAAQNVVKTQGVVSRAAGGFSRIASTAAQAGHAVKTMGTHFVMAGAMIGGIVGPILWLITTGDDLKDMVEAAKQAFVDFRDSLQKALGTDAKAASEVGRMLLGVVRGVGNGVVKWVKENKELAGSILKVITTVAGLATGLVVVGTVLTVAGSAITTIGAAISFVLSPMVMLTAAVIAGAVWWVKYSESGKAAVSALLNAFGPMISTVQKTIKGIADALISGDLSLAAKIAAVGLQLAFMDAAAGIADLLPASWGKVAEDIKRLALDVVTGDWKGAIKDLGKLWGSLCDGMIGAMGSAAKAIQNIWYEAIGNISKQVLELARGDSVLGALLRSIPDIGKGIEAEAKNQLARQKSEALMGKQREYVIGRMEAIIENPTSANEQDLQTLEASGYQTRGMDTPEQEAATLAERVRVASQIRDSMKAEVGQGVRDGVASGMDAGVDQVVASWRDKARNAAKPATEQEGEGGETIEDMLGLEMPTSAKPEKPQTPFDSRRDELRKQLDALNAQAAKQRGETPDPNDLKKLASGSSGTFSARVAGQMGGGPAQQIAKNTKEANERLKDLQKLQRATGGFIENGNKLLATLGARQ